MKAPEQFKLIARVFAYKIPEGFRYLTLGSGGRVVAWKSRPIIGQIDKYDTWKSNGDFSVFIVGQIDMTSNDNKLLVSQWKSCIIALTEIEEKPDRQAMPKGLIGIAKLLDKHHPDCWI